MSGLTQTKQELGRSMLEIIAVIAIMGLLTIIVIPLIRMATNKAKANEIIHDGRAVQTESLARQGDIDPGWQAPDYHSETGKAFAMMRDVKGHDYVKVGGVEKGVCQYMLTMQEEGLLTFLTETDFTPFTECVDQEMGNAMVFAFDGLGAPAECETTMDCEKAHNSNGYYCDQDGHCVGCDSELSDVNLEGDGCECKTNIGAHSCSDDKGHTWCCESEKICGDEMNECATCGDLKTANTDGTACICDASVAVTCEGEKDGQPYTWCCGPDEEGNGQICGEDMDTCTLSDGKCHYIFSQSLEQPKKMATCSYRLTFSNEPVTKYTECQYKVRTRVVNGVEEAYLEVVNNSCQSDEYCYLAYSQSDCGVVASARETENLYGTCLKETVANTTCRMKISDDAFTLTQESGSCQSDEYCYLAYLQSDCSVPVTATAQGLLYGTCLKETVANTTCRMDVSNDAFELMPQQECPANMYCYLKWTNDECNTPVASSVTGNLYGACVSYTTVNPNSCVAPN